MVMLELLKIKTHSPAITKPLLLADIKTKRAPTSLSAGVDPLAISFSSECSLSVFDDGCTGTVSYPPLQTR